MSYKSELQSNNTDLQSILDTVNTLPEGTQLPELSNPAGAGNILNGYESIDADGNKITGTMANNGALSSALNAGGSYTIPAGYTSGGTVTANSLASQTSGTAASADIASGKTAWVNGEKITGTNIGNEGTYVYKKYTKALTVTGSSTKDYYDDGENYEDFTVYSSYAVNNAGNLVGSGTTTLYSVGYVTNGSTQITSQSIANQLIGKYYDYGGTLCKITNATHKWTGSYYRIDLSLDYLAFKETLICYGVMNENKWSSETQVGNYLYKKVL